MGHGSTEGGWSTVTEATCDDPGQSTHALTKDMANFLTDRVPE